MGNIPTTQATESNQTPGIHARADGSGAAVGIGVANLGRGISDLALVGIHISQQQIERRKDLKKLDDIRWASEAFQTEQLHLATMMADPENAKAEDLGDRVANFGKSRLAEYGSDTAPSPEAYNIFKHNYSSYLTRSIIAGIDQGANNKVAAIVNSAQKQISLAQESFRALRNTNPDVAIKTMISSIAQVNTAISEGIGKFAPDKAHKLHEDLITQSALNLMSISPAAAKSVIDSSNEIDEQTRHTLLNEVQSAMRVKLMGQQTAFDNLRNNTTSMLRSGNEADDIPLSEYQKFHADPQAAELKAKDDEEHALYREANLIINEVAPQSREYQDRVLTRLGDKKSWTLENATHKEKLFNHVSKVLSDIKELQQENPAAFLQQFNPHVKHAADMLKTAQGDLISATFSALNSTKLLYQGAPPKDLSASDLPSNSWLKTKEKPLYLNLPLNNQQLLDKDEAKRLADKINKSTPKEVIKTLAETLSQDPNEQHQSVMLNDMVRAGLNQEYQFAWLNKDEPWIDSYLGAVNAGKNVRIDDKIKNDIANLVSNNKTFMAFKQSMIGDNKQRAAQIAGFENGIRQWSNSLVEDGMKKGDAVDLAINKLISSNLGFTEVNGKQMMVLKSRGASQTPRSDTEIQDIGRRLGFVPQFIPLDQVDETPFAQALYPLKDNPDKKREALSDSLNARSFWQTLPDGQGVSLYYRDDNGQNFQVRDKQQHPFVVRFDNLPPFMPVESSITTGIPGSMSRTIIEVPGLKTSFGGKYHAKHPGVTEMNKRSERPTWLETK